MCVSVVLFTVIGVGTLVAADYISDELKTMCANPDSSDISKSLNELYTKTATFYCVAPPNGCTCYVQAPAPTDGGSYSLTSTGSTVTNAQGCSAYLQAAFADYNIDFSDINEIIEYLDLFGEIEEEYTCAGICTQQTKYFFYNSASGYPDKACLNSIRTEMIEGEITNFGIGYTITAAVLIIIWFVQWGLCCRKKPKPGQGGTKNF